jgi:hypothetical protein
MEPDKYERTSIELVEAELERVKEHLREGSVALADGDLVAAEELLDRAKYSHELASFHLEKLLQSEKPLHNLAKLLRENLDELEQQIKKNSSDL